MCRLRNNNSNDRRLRNPGMVVTPYKGSKYKVHPYFYAVNISFHVLNISRLKKKVGVGELCGGGGGVHVGWF